MVPAVRQQVENGQTGLLHGLGHGLGVWLGRLIGTRNDERVPFATTEPAFPSNIFMVQDATVIDAAALSMLRAGDLAGSLSIAGVVSSVGEVVLSQATQNTMLLLSLMKDGKTPIYSGSQAPLALGNTSAAIKEFEEKINATHFYGRNGLSDVESGWPNITTSLQGDNGYMQIAASIIAATPEKSITLAATTCLTDLAKTLKTLLDSDPVASFKNNINAIYIRGGCLDPSYGCNAPSNVPDGKKNAERSFNLDVDAAKYVFSQCEALGIPVVLIPLDLTQEPNLLWTKDQVKALKLINNSVAEQLAKVFDVVPYPDARRFPPNLFPIHDLFAVVAMRFSQFFDATKASISIGDVGELHVNENATDSQKNVYILSMSQAKQQEIYNVILSEFSRFNCLPGSTDEACQFPWKLVLEIGLPSAAAVIGIITLIACNVCTKKKLTSTSKTLDNVKRQRDEARERALGGKESDLLLGENGAKDLPFVSTDVEAPNSDDDDT